MITIERFQIKDQKEVKHFVLDIQNNEFYLNLTETQQPDLVDTEKYFEDGGFWTAKKDGNIVGTIGLQIVDSQNAALRKMFVKKECRGKALNIAQRLLHTLLKFAKMKEIATIWLDTPSVATASHTFYERNGFVQTDKKSLPNGYQYPDKNSKIYALTIR